MVTWFVWTSAMSWCCFGSRSTSNAEIGRNSSDSHCMIRRSFVSCSNVYEIKEGVAISAIAGPGIALHALAKERKAPEDMRQTALLATRSTAWR